MLLVMSVELQLPFRHFYSIYSSFVPTFTFDTPNFLFICSFLCVFLACQLCAFITIVSLCIMLLWPRISILLGRFSRCIGRMCTTRWEKGRERKPQQEKGKRDCTRAIFGEIGQLDLQKDRTGGVRTETKAMNPAKVKRRK